MHKRGIRRPKVGIDPLEARAVPISQVRGTLPERIVYKYLTDRLYLSPEVDFTFQCLAGHHRVLTKDLQWKKISELREGDKLLNFTSERVGCNHGQRQWEVGTVIHNKPSIEDTLKITLSNGQEIICTPEHPWLARYNPPKRDWSKRTSQNWVKAKDLKIGAYIPKFIDTWEEDRSYESGYIAAFIDGEGSIIHGKTSTGGHCMALTATQNEGVVLDEYIKCVNHLGFDFSDYNYSHITDKRHDIRIKGGRSETIRLLGTCRPQKLGTQFEPDKLGKLTRIQDVKIVDIAPNGEYEIYKLAVDNETYIAEGFGMHNSSMLGGRMMLGGIVADFVFPIKRIVIQVQGVTHRDFLRMRKDTEQVEILEDFGYDVFGIDDTTIYNAPLFEQTMQRIFDLWGSESETG
jgi:hypothetical protein